MSNWPSRGEAVIRRLGQQSLYYTVAVTPECKTLRAFTSPVGSCVPGAPGNAVSSCRETNVYTYRLVEQETEWIGFGWSIAAMTPSEFGFDGRSYRVTQEDVDEFVHRALIRLFFRGPEMPFLDLVPDQHAVVHDACGWRQHVGLPPGTIVRPGDHLHADLTWPHGPPKLSDSSAVLMVTLRMMTLADRFKVFGLNSLFDGEESLFVAVGKRGLEELLEKVLWFPPTGSGGEK